MKRAAIGVDIGGESVKLGLVDERGRLLERETFLTRGLTRMALIDVLSAHVGDLASRAGGRRLKLLGVGIGAPGPIDVERGFVTFFPNIPGWKNTPLKSILDRRLRMPVRLDNDANVMALAESAFGAAKGAGNVIALTLGTGVGGGLLIGGSGYFMRALPPKLRLSARTPLDVERAARAGNREARQAWETAGRRLGGFLAGLANLLNPEGIVIGGGIARSGALLFGPLRRALRKNAFPIAARSVRVVPAKLGVDAGITGAAALLFFPQ